MSLGATLTIDQNTDANFFTNISTESTCYTPFGHIQGKNFQIDIVKLRSFLHFALWTLVDFIVVAPHTFRNEKKNTQNSLVGICVGQTLYATNHPKHFHVLAFSPP